MSDPEGQKADSESGKPGPAPSDAQKAIHRNLNSFLNPSFPIPGKKPAPEPNPKGKPPAPDFKGAAQLRMAQMELANKMRLQQSKKQKEEGSAKSAPARPTPPPGGFGSAQGMFHLQRGNFGKPKPAASKRSPYQQILANASKPQEEEPKSQDSAKGDQGQEVIDVPLDAEVKQNEKPKRSRGKRFRNPSL